MSASSISKLAETVSAMCSAETPEMLKRSISEGIAAYGFDSFTLSINARDRHELALAPRLTSYSDKIFRDYERFGFAQSDPVLARTTSTADPFVWDSASQHRHTTDRRLADYFRALPVIHGLVVPLPSLPGHASSLSVATAAAIGRDPELAHHLSIIARVAMLRVEAMGDGAGSNQARLVDAGLSAQQLLILGWAARGKSNTDIATITGQTPRTVAYHMSEILRKLRVSSRQQAIAILVAQGSEAPR